MKRRPAFVLGIGATVVGAALSGCASMAPAERQARILPESCARPSYPREALMQRVQGKVGMAMLVGADGKVRDAEVRRSSGDESLDLAALRALSTCSFRPALLAGAATQQWTDVQYAWRLR
ncbi:energy transducer TonB [Massilia sp. IC2-477]|uniref:energy transducer TonB n=1 Tax=Massilia sp. IC2-477 TaxID=2887198 RepID=UPI001D10A79A|nr:energy transducer TonB [Massilia sp. IC2-477]MCC2958658.1 energy transducer TonB [Massilia sp. IC2-477]